MENEPVSISFEQRLIKAKTAAERISSMIQFTKEYEDIGEHIPTWQNVRSLVDKSADEVHLGQITLQNDVPSSIEMFADPLIVKVFHNLVDNAIKHGGNTDPDTILRGGERRNEGRSSARTMGRVSPPR